MTRTIPSFFLILHCTYALAIQESPTAKSPMMEAFKANHQLGVSIPTNKKDISECKAVDPPNPAPDVSAHRKKPLVSLLEQAEYAQLGFVDNFDLLIEGYEALWQGIEAHKKKHYAEAYQHFQSVVKKGLHTEAQYLLGSMLIFGHGVGKSQSMGVELIRMASKNGSTPATHDLAQWAQKSPQFLYPSYIVQEGARKIRHLIDGLKALKKAEHENALLFFIRAVDTRTTGIDSSAEDLYILGHAYLVTGKNQELGAKYLSAASDRGHKPATFDLGLRYLTGNGVGKNPFLAAAFLQNYSDDPKFQYHRGLALYSMNNAAREAIGLRLIEQAAKNRYPLAERALEGSGQ